MGRQTRKKKLRKGIVKASKEFIELPKDSKGRLIYRGPKVFKATEAGFVAFCGCKHSKDETGKCDGTHSSL